LLTADAIHAGEGKFVAEDCDPDLYSDTQLVRRFTIGTTNGITLSAPDLPCKAHACGVAKTTDASTWKTVCSVTLPNSWDVTKVVGGASCTTAGPSSHLRDIKCHVIPGTGVVGTIYYGGDGTSANIRISESAGVVKLEVVGDAVDLYWVGDLDATGVNLP
jgi:hypothetical protein